MPPNLSLSPRDWAHGIWRVKELKTKGNYILKIGTGYAQPGVVWFVLPQTFRRTVRPNAHEAGHQHHLQSGARRDGVDQPLDNPRPFARLKSNRRNVVSALTARTQLGQILRRACEKDERFVVDRRGNPSVIIMSVRDYIRNIAPTPAAT